MNLRTTGRAKNRLPEVKKNPVPSDNSSSFLWPPYSRNWYTTTAVVHRPLRSTRDGLVFLRIEYVHPPPPASYTIFVTSPPSPNNTTKPLTRLTKSTATKPRPPTQPKTPTTPSFFILCSGRRRRRNRIIVAVLVSTVVVLAFLPILSEPEATTLSPPATTRPAAELGTNGVGAGHISSKVNAAAAATAPAALSAAVAKSGGSGGSDGSGSGSGSSEQGESTLRHSAAGDALRAQESGEGATGGVNRSRGGGGKLKDGRDRCFTDSEGFHRCYPTVFFFGTSKCGKLFQLFPGLMGIRCWRR